MLTVLVCVAVLSLVAVIAVRSRNVGAAIGLAALAMRVVYAIPGVRKPPELRIAQCLSKLKPVLAEHAPSVRDHHARRSKRDGHLQLSLIVATDQDVPTAKSKHDGLIGALRSAMASEHFSDAEIAALRIDFVSAEEIERGGGAFHYWREHGE
jgi:hypothetical protein